MRLDNACHEMLLQGWPCDSRTAMPIDESSMPTSSSLIPAFPIGGRSTARASRAFGKALAEGTGQQAIGSCDRSFERHGAVVDRPGSTKPIQTKRNNEGVTARNSPRVWDMGWPPLLGSTFIFGGIVARSLTSAMDLDSEGSEMNHCVGSYADACAAGTTHIISLRGTDCEFERVGFEIIEYRSTAEIRIIDSGLGYWDLQVEQHVGYHNSSPPKRCTRALEALIENLKFDSNRQWLEELQQKCQ